jgi:hypothetical protein
VAGLSNLADWWEARERLNLLRSWQEELQDNLPSPPAAVVIDFKDEGPRVRAFYRNQREQDDLSRNLLNNFRTYGFPVEELEAEIERRKERIRGDAVYTTVLPDDQALIWNHDGRLKQEWHLRQAPILAGIEYLRRIIEQYTPRAQLVPLLQARRNARQVTLDASSRSQQAN